jgi:hypothetical protein
MTLPGSIGGYVPDGPDWIGRELRDLRRETAELRTARTLEAATIGRGGITVRGGAITVQDASGADTLATLGGSGLSISAGGSIHVHDGGTLTVDDAAGHSMPLSQLAFGMGADSTSGSITPAANAWAAGGLSADVEVTAGRLVVIVSCKMVVGSSGGGTPCQGSMSYDLSGPDDVGPDRGRGVHFEFNGSGMNFTGQASFVYVHTGLAAGTYTVADRYMSDSTGSPQNKTTYDNRSVLALPF